MDFNITYLRPNSSRVNLFPLILRHSSSNAISRARSLYSGWTYFLGPLVRPQDTIWGFLHCSAELRKVPTAGNLAKKGPRSFLNHKNGLNAKLISQCVQIVAPIPKIHFFAGKLTNRRIRRHISPVTYHQRQQPQIQTLPLLTPPLCSVGRFNRLVPQNPRTKIKK